MRTLWPRIEGYAIAVLLVIAALGMGLALNRMLPFTFFLAAVMLTAWFCGSRSGIFALLLSLPALNVLLGQPPYAFGVSVEYAPRLLTYAVSAVFVLWMSAGRRRAERALRTARDELEERVRERTASLEQAYRRLQVASAADTPS